MTIAELEALDRDGLLEAWSNVFGAPAPKTMSRFFLRHFLAFELQTRQSGGLTKSVRKALETGTEETNKLNSPALKPGGRLIREWNGVTHVVDVQDNRFSWNDETYRSLSAIAREITGAHWSGPRFFGLTGKSTP